MALYTKTQLACSTSTWTPFVVPVPCNSIIFRNTTGIQVNLRTNQNDATTQDTLQPGDQEVLDPAMKQVCVGASNNARFAPGLTIAYFELGSGTATSTSITVSMYGEL